MSLKAIKKILILVAVCIAASCGKKAEKDSTGDLTKGFSDYMMMNLFQGKEFPLTSFYLLKNIKGESCRIDSIFKKSKLVFRFSENNYDIDIRTEIERINKIGLADNIIGLVSCNNIRMFKLAKEKYKIQFPIYFLPLRDELPLPESKEASASPYYFWVGTDLRARYIFSPSQQYADIADEYLSAIINMLKEQEKNADVFDLKNMNLGTVIKGKTYKIKFEYTNRTPGYLVINSVKASCNCTVTEWTKEPSAYDKSAELIVTFTPESLGYNSKTIMVSHNKSTHPERLTIVADVINDDL